MIFSYTVRLKPIKMKTSALKLIAVFAAVAIVVLVSCSKSTNGEESKLVVRLTDNPIPYKEVNVDIREVNVKFTDDTSAVNGWANMPAFPGVYNLLRFQNGIDTVLATATFPQSTVREIRFVLGPNNSIVDTNGIRYPLTIPSGAESGLKIKVNKSLNASIETLIIDFDAALSIIKEGNGEYKLKPVLRVK
jgi:hypothetical protein